MNARTVNIFASYLLRGSRDHGVGSTDHFSALKIWMFENKFVSLPSHLKTIEPMEVHRESRTMCNTETSKSDQKNRMIPERLTSDLRADLRARFLQLVENQKKQTLVK